MRLVISGQKFVDDYSFINKIDMKGAASQLATLVFEVVWRADDGGNTARREVILQQGRIRWMSAGLPNRESQCLARPSRPIRDTWQAAFPAVFQPGRTASNGSVVQRLPLWGA